MSKLSIEYWPLSQLQAHPKNPKSHAIEKIEESMQRFGFTSPILIDERTQRICAGHGRLETLTKLQAQDGNAPPKGVHLDRNEWTVPVVRGLSFADDHELEAYLIADNRLTEVGGWDGARLLPFGLDWPAFRAGLTALAQSLNVEPSEVWTVAGSGTLSRALQEAWPRAKFYAVMVGAKSDVGRAIKIDAGVPFARKAKLLPPFPSCDNYDAKAWAFMKKQATPGALFWNVSA